jgi:hypothetical protein
MRFSLKTLEQRYGLETEHTAGSVTADVRLQVQTYGPECDRGLYFHQAVS